MKWPTGSLDSIAILDRQSIHPSEVDAATPYLGLEHLDGDGGIDRTQTVGSAGLKSNKFQFSDRHVLFGKLRPYLRKIVRPRFSGVCSTDIIPILPKEGVSRDFLFYFLRTPDTVNLATSLCSGANLPRLGPKQLASFQIPLPPFDEQKRIVEILDKAEALRAKRRDALTQLDTLLQSTFLDMFGDPVDNPMGLRRESLKSAFEFTTGKLDSNAAVEGGKYPFFTCARETSAIDDYAFDCEALLLAGNNANADYSVKHYKGRFNAYQRTYVITIKESALTYAYARLVLEYLLGDLKRFSKGTNTKYLTLVILNRMPILVPPLDLQHRFAAIVESVEHQKARQRAHLAKLDTLFASLQSRAFRGEL